MRSRRGQQHPARRLVECQIIQSHVRLIDAPTFISLFRPVGDAVMVIAAERYESSHANIFQNGRWYLTLVDGAPKGPPRPFRNHPGRSRGSSCSARVGHALVQIWRTERVLYRSTYLTPAPPLTVRNAMPRRHFSEPRQSIEYPGHRSPPSRVRRFPGNRRRGLHCCREHP
jgi:hypothetical protein